MCTFTSISRAVTDTSRRGSRWLGLTLLTASLFAGCGSDSVTRSRGGDGDDDPIDVVYTFESGPTGDGFVWPAQLLEREDADDPATTFRSPHGVVFWHALGNIVFFDASYILPDETAVENGITGKAVWGAPRPIDDLAVPSLYIQLHTPVTSIAFDFAWVAAGSGAPAAVELAVSGELTGGEFISVPLPQRFGAGAPFGDTIGRAGRVELSVASLAKEHGLSFSRIGLVTVFLDPIAKLSGASEFAIDNVAVKR